MPKVAGHTRRRAQKAAFRMPPANGTRNVLVIGDLHVGSMYGLLPPDFVSCDGAEKPQNEGQKYLWECWEDLKHRVARFSIDCVVVNGDVIEGKQPKQKASELTLVGPNDQEAAAVFLLRDLRNWLAKNMRREVPFYFIQGTEYHDGRGAEELESIAARIEGANIDPALTGRYCKEVLDLDIGGVSLNFAHHVGGGAGFSRSGTIDAEAVWAQLASSKGQAKPPDLPSTCCPCYRRGSTGSLSKGKQAKDAFMHTAKRFLTNETVQGFNSHERTLAGSNRPNVLLCLRPVSV